ncbi:hypothetical protein [Vibrio parahaemolyticus]|uniref:hypothetical protein n=1 Tax=Vibrio parahaemolyticus TaxID=670 RepID=UPI00344E1CBA
MKPMTKSDKLLDVVLNLTPEDIQKILSKLNTEEEKREFDFLISQYAKNTLRKIKQKFSIPKIYRDIFGDEAAKYIVSMSFQNALGIEFVLVTDEKETKASTGHHLLKWHLPSRDNVIVPNSWTGLDNMRLYTPSSVKERYSAFDKQTFEIMSLSCNEVLIDAYRHAPKLNSQYSSLYNELHQLCDCHLLLLFVHEHYRLAEIMTQSIVDHYENECRFEKKENQVLVTILVGFLSFKRLISRSTACGISLKKSMRSLLIRTTYQPGTITLMSYIC